MCYTRIEGPHDMPTQLHPLHPMIHIRILQGVHQPKMSPNGLRKGLADPLLSPIRPIFLKAVPITFLTSVPAC